MQRARKRKSAGWIFRCVNQLSRGVHDRPRIESMGDSHVDSRWQNLRLSCDRKTIATAMSAIKIP